MLREIVESDVIKGFQKDIDDINALIDKMVKDKNKKGLDALSKDLGNILKQVDKMEKK